MHSELVEAGEVCVVLVVHGLSIHLFGVYDSEATARKRVEDHRNLGLISDDDVIHYNSEIVWKGAE